MFQNVINFPAHTAKVTCLAWSPDSSKFATGSIDTNIVVWKPSQGMSPKIIKGRLDIFVVVHTKVT